MKRLILLIASLLTGGCWVKDVARQDAVAIFSNAAWLAYQDGPLRDWQVIVSGNDNTEPKAYALQASDLEKRYALALVCPAGESGQAHRLYLVYASADAVNNLRQGCEAPPENRARFQVSGNLYDEAAYINERVRLSFAPEEWIEAFTAYAVEVPEGKTDILAVKGPVEDGRLRPRRFYIQRGYELDSGGDNVNLQKTEVDLVFADPSGLPAMETPATLSLVPTLDAGESRWQAEVALVSKEGNELPLLLLTESDGVQQAPFYGLDRRYLREGEGHRARLQALDAQDRVRRAATRLFVQPGDARLPLPAGFDPLPQIAATELSWQAPLEDPAYGPRRLAVWRLDGSNADGDPVQWWVYVSDAWLAEAESDGRLHLPLPDFSALNGWDTRWSAPTFDRWHLTQYFSDDGAGELLAYVIQDQLRDGLAYGEVRRQGP